REEAELRERAEAERAARAEAERREREEAELRERAEAERAARAEAERREREEAELRERAEAERAARAEAERREREEAELREREEADRRARTEAEHGARPREAEAAERRARERGAAAARMISRPHGTDVAAAVTVGTVSHEPPAEALPDAERLREAVEQLAHLRADRVAHEKEARDRILAAEREHTRVALSSSDERAPGAVGIVGDADGRSEGQPVVPLWPAIPDTTDGQPAVPVVRMRRGFGDEAELDAEDPPEPEDEEWHARPYSWVHWVALIAVAFVLGMLIIMVITRDGSAAPNGAAAASWVGAVLPPGVP
ncbi:hypothetical protein Q6346_02530, partial [Isoptericola sp. b490]|uniref:hypothetical protein n=1 Tax=Actinotalea lenta TaxID=3064654 RepID=UPI0027141A2E|nr:hypothetical protein [Isoptericola sp. b490]